MKQLLHISDQLKLPALEAQTQTIVVYGGKGMGKTNFGAVLAEELAKNHLKFSWIDPVGVAWGLKHSGDGRGPGVEVLILGGIHGDLPINPNAGAIVADLVVDEDVSVIIDISRHPDGRMWSAGEKIRFVHDYCVRLFERQGEQRRPIMQIIDEAGRFVPQQMPKGSFEIAECVGAIEQLVELGRNVGAGVALITQRSARMNKSVSELAEIMVAFRTVGPRSIDAIVDWFGEHVPKERQRELIEQLRKLDRGTALIVSPGWLDVEGAYTIRARETFDSSATPVAGKERKPRGRGATVDKGKYVERMAETIEAAKENDPAELKKQIRELSKRLERAESKTTVLEKAGVGEPRTVEIEKVVEVAVPVFDFEKFLAMQDVIKLEPLSELVDQLTNVRQAIYDGLEDLRIRTRGIRSTSSAERAPVAAKPAPSPAQRGAAARAEPAGQAKLTLARSADDADVKIGKGERKVLEVLAEYPEGRTQNELAFLAGYSAKASTVGVILANLRRAGLVEPGQPIRSTHEGLEAAGGVRERPTGQALLDEWLRHPRMGEGERRVLLALIDAGGEELSHDELCALTGYSPTASTMGVILSKLRKLGLVEKGARRIAPEFREAIAA